MSKGTFEEFLAALRSFESGIDPSQAEKYKKGYDDPRATKYWNVESPGVPLFKGGKIEQSDVSYREYFKRLGVEGLYDNFKLMQYASINYLGFVGYQVGESVVIETGYYKAPIKNFKTPSGDDVTGPSYYVFIPRDSKYWREFTSKDDTVPFRWTEDSEWILATAYNKWEGSWTGKHDITSLKDLKKPENGDRVIKDVMAHNLSTVIRTLKGTKTESDYATLKRWIGNEVSLKSSAGVVTTVKVTMSGLLAGAHLAGAAGVANALITGTDPGDESGTRLSTYINNYQDYATIFDSPGDDEIIAQSGDTVTCGWGHDTVTIASHIEGQPVHIILHESETAGDTTDIKGFDANSDRIVIRDWKQPLEFEPDGMTPKSPSTVTKYNNDLIFGQLGQKSQKLTLHDLDSEVIGKIKYASMFIIGHSWQLKWGGDPDIFLFNVDADVLLPAGGMAFKHLYIWDDKWKSDQGATIHLKDENNYYYIVAVLSGVSSTKLTEENFSENFMGTYKDIHWKPDS